MRLQGVLYGQGVQPELLRDLVELPLRGLVQTDPDEGVPLGATLRQRVGEVLGPLRPASVAVDGTVDDHGGYSPAARPRAHPGGSLGPVVRLPPSGRTTGV